MWFFIVILATVLFLYHLHKKVIEANLKVKQVEATMNIYLSKKYELLGNLITFFDHYTDISKIQFPTYSIATEEVSVVEKSNRYAELIETQNTLEEMTQIIVESKMDVVLQNMMSELRENEAQLIACFRFYNNNVTQYNEALMKYPLSFLIKKENYHLISNI